MDFQGGSGKKTRFLWDSNEVGDDQASAGDSNEVGEDQVSSGDSNEVGDEQISAGDSNEVGDEQKYSSGALFTRIGNGSDVPECQGDDIQECWKVSLNVDKISSLRLNDEVQFFDQEPSFTLKVSQSNETLKLVYYIGRELEPYPENCSGCFADQNITFSVLEVAAIAAKQLAGVSAVSNQCNHTRLLEVIDVQTQVVAGTNYKLTLKMNTKSGPNCENLDTQVCSDIVAFRPIPVRCYQPDTHDKCIEVKPNGEISCTDGQNIQGTGTPATAYNPTFTDLQTGLDANLLVATYPDGDLDVSGTAASAEKIFTVKPCSGKGCLVMYWRKNPQPFLITEATPALEPTHHSLSQPARGFIRSLSLYE